MVGFWSSASRFHGSNSRHVVTHSFDFIWMDAYRTVSFKLAADGWRNDESDSY